MKSVRLPVLTARELDMVRDRNGLGADKGRWSTTIYALKRGLLQTFQAKAQTKAQRVAWFWLDKETSRLLEERAKNLGVSEDQIALQAILSYLSKL